MIESTTGHDVHEMIISGDATGCSTSAGGGAGGEIILNDVLGMKNQTLVINTSAAAAASQSDGSVSSKQKLTSSAGAVSTDKKYSPPDYASKEKVCVRTCDIKSPVLLLRFYIVPRYIWISWVCNLPPGAIGVRSTFIVDDVMIIVWKTDHKVH